MIRARAWRIAGLAVLFGSVAGLRYLTLAGLSNDHYFHLTPARQWLLGEWPTRDFLDPGEPLMYGASAFAQLVLGSTLWAEGVFVTAMFGVAAVLTYLATRRVAGSSALALGAVAFEVAIFPRAYSYPKILLYSAGLLLYSGYLARPTRLRLVWIGALVAIAFLMRHDHGIFLGVGGTLAALCAAGTAAHRVRRALLLIAVVAVVLSPYAAYVYGSAGFDIYLDTALGYSTREAARTGLVWARLILSPAPVVLLAAFYLLPVAALAVLWARRREWPMDAPIVPAVALAFLVNLGFLRDPLEARLPDAVVPAVVLGAWLARRAWTLERGRSAALAGMFLMVVSSGWATWEIGRVGDELNQMNVSGPSDVVARFRAQTTALKSRFPPRRMTTRFVQGLTPVFGYLDRCTTPADRVLTAGFMPEVPYYARRGFAGGQLVFMNGYYTSEALQQRVVQRLRRQRVPIALVPSDYAVDLAEDFRVVSAHVRGRYQTLATIEIDDEVSVEVLVDSELQALSRDIVTGWPCFR